MIFKEKMLGIPSFPYTQRSTQSHAYPHSTHRHTHGHTHTHTHTHSSSLPHLSDRVRWIRQFFFGKITIVQGDQINVPPAPSWAKMKNPPGKLSIVFSNTNNLFRYYLENIIYASITHTDKRISYPLLTGFAELF